MMSRFFSALDRNLEKVPAICFLGVMVVLASLVVFYRFVLDKGFSAAEELERMAFVWFVYMSVAYAAREGTHIRVEAHLGLVNKKAWRILRIVADGIWIWFNCIIIREGIDLVHSMIQFPYESPALGWSMAFPYLIIPISFTLMSVRIIPHMVREIKGLKE
jgi:C4-dicarboxylate transporter, DctQ subunit